MMADATEIRSLLRNPQKTEEYVSYSFVAINVIGRTVIMAIS